MTNYQELAKKSSQQLESLKIQKGTLQEKIKNLAESLDLDPSKDLLSQIKELKESLESKRKEQQSKLDELVKQLNEIDNVQ